MKKILLASHLLVLSVTAGFTQHHQHGDENGIDSLSHRHISEVTVEGVIPGKLNFPYQAISGKAIEAHGFMTPGDALHHVSGVSLSRDGTWATSINIRGFSESKLLFMVDGDRMLSATDLAGTLSTVDMSNVERIEVIKGAGSVLFGTNAMGGIVNFITRRPGYTDDMHATGSVSSGFNTVNYLWQNNVNVNLTNTDWYLAFDGSYRMAQNTATPAGVIHNSQFNDASWGIKGGMKQGENQELLVNYNHFEAWDVGLPGGRVFPENAAVRYLGFSRNQLSGEYIFSDVTDVLRELKFKAYTQNINRDVENIVSPTTAVFPGSVNVTSGLRATADLFFNPYESMTVGVEGWLRDHQTSRMKIATVSDTIVIKEQPTPEASMLDVGVFAQHKWVVDPKYWTINTGLRLDIIQTVNDTALKEIARYTYDNGVKTELNPDRTVLFLNDRVNELAYAAHVDVMYQPANRHKIMLSLANAYRIASLEERFKYIDQQGTLRVGSPDLKPEKVLSANLNYTFLGERAVLTTNLFGNYLFDLITEAFGMYALPGNPPVQAWVSKNVDQAYFVGGEIDLKWLIAPELELESHASYVHAVDRATGDLLPLIPPLHGLASVHYHFHPKLGAALAVHWEYETSHALHEGLEEEDAHQHATVDLYLHSVALPLGHHLKWQFFSGVQNVFDLAYQEHLSTLRGMNQLEPGRNIFLKMKLMW